MSWFSNLMGFSPAKTRDVDVSGLEGYASQFFGPMSPLNRAMYQSIKQTGIDSLSQQHNMGRRMQAAGQNPFAGGQYRAGFSDMLGQTNQAFNQHMMGSRETGAGLLGQALQGRMSNAQSYNEAAMLAQNNRANFFQNILGQAMQAGPSYLWGPTGG